MEDDVTLPEEEEYEQERAREGVMTQEDFEKEVGTLLALALGIVIMVAVAMAALVALYALTGWTGFLLLNLLVAMMALIAFIYLRYRRSLLTMRF